VTDRPDLGSEAGFSRLSDLSPEVRGHPLFRQGYNHGYSDRAREEHLARSPVGTGTASPVLTRQSSIYDVTAGGLRHRLAPGARAIRDLSSLTTEFLVTDTPCCGRHVALAIPGPDETRPAVCCRCRVLFAVGLIQEEPDGFGGESPHVAIFVVEQMDVAVALHRAGRWERHSGKP
jgi:hypothetical protein